MVKSFYLMWPSDSKSMPNCITKWDNWDIPAFNYILLRVLNYMNIYYENLGFFL